MEAFHTANLDGIRTGTADTGTHGVQEVGQIHDMRLLGCVLNDGLTGQKAGCHDDVDGSAYADHVQTDTAAMKPHCTGGQVDIVLRLIHIGTQGPEAFDMLVDGTGCKVAPAGQCHTGPVEAAEQRTHNIVAGAHFPHQIGIRVEIGDLGTIQNYHTIGFSGDNGTHIRQNIQQDTHIGNIRHVLYAAHALHEQCCRKNCHRCILRAADGNGSFQTAAAGDLVFNQG